VIFQEKEKEKIVEFTLENQNFPKKIQFFFEKMKKNF
jgi:hypothetical protein